MKTVLLGEVADIQGGGTPPTSRHDYFGGQLPWFTPTEIVAGKISFLVDSVRTLTDQGAVFTAIADPGTVLLTSRAGIGKVGILEKRAGFNQGIKAIKPVQGKLDSLYIAYWLIHNKDLLEERASGTTFLEISGTSLRNLEIPCPEIEEQKRTVKKLDKAFAVIDKAKQNSEKNLQGSRELFNRQLDIEYSKTGDRTTSLGDVCEFQNGYAFESKFFSENKGISLIRIRDIKNGIHTKTRYEGSFDESYLVERGDYLIGMDGEFRCYEWKGEPALLNQRVCRLRSHSNEITPRFLFYGINKYLKEIEAKTSFTTVKHISIKQIRGIEFPLPDMEQQVRITQHLDQLSEQTQKLQELYRKKLAALEELRESILKQAFDGKL